MNLIENLRQTRDDRKRALDEWAAKFAANPIHELRWVAKAVAAEYDLLNDVVAFLSDEADPDLRGDRIGTLIDDFRDDLKRLSRSQRRSSTSLCANLAEEAARVAKAKLLEYIERVTAA